MIARDATVSIRRIQLFNIQICEFQERYPEKLLHYIKLMKEYPESDVGVLHVTPSKGFGGMYILLDGHHKFCASIMTGRSDALCIVIEQPKGT